jgi:hypothetical protein
MAAASSRVPIPFCSSRRPRSHTPAMTPMAIISPYMRSCRSPMWIDPESGLGIEASDSAPSASDTGITTTRR